MMIQGLRRVAGYGGGLVLLMAMVGSAWADRNRPWGAGFETTVFTDDNIGRAQNDSDIQNDIALVGKVDANYTWELSPSKALTAASFVQLEEFTDYEGLSSTQYGGTLDYRFQTRAGFTAPVYSIFVGISEGDFETDIRDGTTIDFGFRITRRITDRITGTAGATLTDRSARGEVFDLERTRYFLNADYRINAHWSAYITYNYIDGDVFSSATPTLPILNWADAIEPDNAFGGLGNNKLAYRLDAVTTIWRYGVNIGLNHTNAIDISIDDLNSDAAGPNEYDRLSVAVAFLHRF
jgi:hypothetical protein